MSHFGTFQHCVTKEDVDFNSNFYPREQMEPLIGAKVTVVTKDVGIGKIFAHWTIDKCPEMNSVGIFKEGVENHMDMPMFGGKVKITYKKCGNGYETVAENEKYGKFEFKEVYDETGYNLTTTKDGKSHTEKYTRILNMDGMYKVKTLTGVKEYMRNDGMPESLIQGLDEYMICVKVCENGMKMRESWGDALKLHMSFEFDKEFDYKFPLEGVPASKYLVTKAGFGKYNSVMKTADGGVQEWKFHFCDAGLRITGTNMKSGDTCTLDLYKEQCPVEGSWKVVSIAGASDLMKAVGCPADMACKFDQEIGLILDVEKRGPMIRWKWNSKITPMDISFKMNEEIEFYDPVFQETMKSVASCSGNTMTFISKSSHGTWITKSVVGHAFNVVKSWLEGMECMPMTYISVRQS